MAWTGFSPAELNRLNDNEVSSLTNQKLRQGKKSENTAIVRPAQRQPLTNRKGQPKVKLGDITTSTAAPPTAGEGDTSRSRITTADDKNLHRDSTSATGRNLHRDSTTRGGGGDTVQADGGGSGNNAANVSPGDKGESIGNTNVCATVDVAKPSTELRSIETSFSTSTPTKITEKDKLQEFQNKQKQIEELNKKKRAELSFQIKERQKAAREESLKMSLLQKQLTKMDEQLTVDVSVIRDDIEAASFTYNDALRRYDLAEKELIASKLDLHARSEVKEKLTEKLYLVINRNEQRKSQRLSQLMLELNHEGNTPEEKPDSTLLDMPPLIPAVETAIITPRPAQMKQFASKLKSEQSLQDCKARGNLVIKENVDKATVNSEYDNKEQLDNKDKNAVIKQDETVTAKDTDKVKDKDKYKDNDNDKVISIPLTNNDDKSNIKDEIQ